MSKLRELYASLRPVRAAAGPVNPDVTIVTGYVAIDRVPDGTEPAFARRTPGQYLDWMRAMLSIRQNMAIFVEESARPLVEEVRRPLAAHTYIETVDVESLRTSPWHREVQRIIDEGHMRHAVRPNRVELKTALYNTIMFFKWRWVRRAIERDPFHTKYFLWMDAGFGHGLDRRRRYRSVMNGVWPSATKNGRMADTVLVLGTGLHARHMSAAELMATHNHVVAGTVWGGDRQKMLAFCDLFEQEVESTLKDNLLDDDQSVMTLVWQKHPELFTTIDCTSILRDRCYFLKYLDAGWP